MINYQFENVVKFKEFKTIDNKFILVNNTNNNNKVYIFRNSFCQISGLNITLENDAKCIVHQFCDNGQLSYICKSFLTTQKTLYRFDSSPFQPS